MVINISKEGERLSDLSGIVVSKKEAGAVYDLIRRLNAKREEGTGEHEKNVSAREPRGMAQKTS